MAGLRSTTNLAAQCRSGAVAERLHHVQYLWPLDSRARRRSMVYAGATHRRKRTAA